MNSQQEGEKMNVYHNLYAGFLAGTKLLPADQERILFDIARTSAKTCKEHRTDIEQNLANKTIVDGGNLLEGYQVGKWTQGSKTLTVTPWDSAKMKDEFDKLAHDYTKSNSRGFQIAAAVFAVIAAALAVVAGVFFPISLVVAGACFGAMIIATILAASFGTQTGKQETPFYDKAIERIAQQTVFQAQQLIQDGGEAVIGKAAQAYFDACKWGPVEKGKIPAEIEHSLYQDVGGNGTGLNEQRIRLLAARSLVDRFIDCSNSRVPKISFANLKPSK